MTANPMQFKERNSQLGAVDSTEIVYRQHFDLFQCEMTECFLNITIIEDDRFQRSVKCENAPSAPCDKLLAKQNQMSRECSACIHL